MRELITTQRKAGGLATRLGLGQLAATVYHGPRGWLYKLIDDGGPLERLRTADGERQMRHAASQLNVPRQSGRSLPYEIHLLTGQNYWHQSIFCVASLELAAASRLQPVFYDDGSLHESSRSALERVFPLMQFQARHQIEARLDRSLPSSKFPTLRGRRLEYPHLRKLTDIHVGSQGWKIVLDSDLLFWRRPERLLQWAALPKENLCLTDVSDAYGYSRQLMQMLAGRSVPGRVNVGICCLNSSSIDWERVEYNCKIMIDQEGKSYLQEQALCSLIMAEGNLEWLPSEEYIVKPSALEARAPSAILHHYVSNSKNHYFQNNWRMLLRRLVEGEI